MTSSTQFERRAEQARDRLSSHLQDLRYHVSPSTIVSELLDLKGLARGFENVIPSFAGQARTIPGLLLIAAGLAWLAYSEATSPAAKKPSRRGARNRASGKTRGRRKVNVT
jgi:hypothetical protein